jgi:hypothetical protein
LQAARKLSRALAGKIVWVVNVMTNEEERILNLVRTAFRNVVLGDGVGLWQGQGLDDYADSRTLESYRAQDEKSDWSAISVEQLDRCYSSLSFFDAEGMRFHLPSYLSADLQGELRTADVLFTLTCFEYLGTSRFENLNAAQRNAVREFLLLRLSDSDYEFSHPMIECALRDYWKATPDS